MILPVIYSKALIEEKDKKYVAKFSFTTDLYSVVKAEFIAMLISGNIKLNQIKNCIEAAHNFLLSKEEALEIFANQKEIIEKNWQLVCGEAELTDVDKKLFWQRQFLNPFALENLDGG